MLQPTFTSDSIPTQPYVDERIELRQDIRIGLWPEADGPVSLAPYVPIELVPELDSFDQGTIPRLAHTREATRRIASALPMVPTRHIVSQGDSRRFDGIDDESIHLIVTSPPYWTLKEYPPNRDQLGAVEDYEDFNKQLALVWEEARRVLVPGGRLVIVVGDVNLARRRFGRHVVMPLHATIQEHCRRAGLDNLAPIIWQKIANASYEAGGNGPFLGKPYFVVNRELAPRVERAWILSDVYGSDHCPIGIELNV